MTDSATLWAAVAVAISANLALRYFLRREQDPLLKALKLFRLNLAVVAGFCLLLWWQLPITPALKTFGYPQAEIDVQSAKSLLRYLQDYNRALVTTTEVLSRFLWVFVWLFMLMLFDLSKTLSGRIGQEAASHHQASMQLGRAAGAAHEAPADFTLKLPRPRFGSAAELPASSPA